MENQIMLTDLYQLTMNAAYLDNNIGHEIATFDYFIRSLPKNRGYFLTAGLEDLIDYIINLRFSDSDLAYLKSQNIFSESFLNHLQNFKFSGDIYAVPEGTIVFPNEPIIRVTAPRMEAQFIETFLLTIMNHQTMIATKTSRVVEAAQGRAIIDFGARRAHGKDAAVKGARAAYIGGAAGTSNVLAGQLYNIPIKGTHAHSFVMSFDSELEAFSAYVKTFPNNATLLIDTYNVMQGARNALIVAKKLEQAGKKLFAVRLDSGDLVEDSKRIREFFDSHGVEYIKILASNDLNEYKINGILGNGAKIDAFGVGTEMITSKDCPALSGVYKLAESETNGTLVAKIKLSEGKQTLPGRKQIYRIFNKADSYLKDIIALENERVEGTPLLIPVFKDGKLVYEKPALNKIQEYAKENLARLPLQYRKITNPEYYPVELSKGLQILIRTLIERYNSQKPLEVPK